MSPMTVDAVLSKLESLDAVPVGTRERAGEVLAVERPSLPWYARGLTGFYGWVAAAFFLVFAWFSYWSDDQQVLFGLLAVAAGIGLRRFFQRGYLAHLSLSLALAGELCAVWGMSDLAGYHSLATPLFMLGVELLLFFAYPDSLMRFLCSLGVCSALFRIWERTTGNRELDLLLLAALACSLLLFHFRPRLERTRFARMISPAAYGLAIAACGWMLGALDKWEHLTIGWPGRIGVALVLLGQLALMVRDQKRVAIAALFVAALAGLSFGSPGVLAGAALLAAALHRRETKLIGLAAVFLVFFYSYLYYSMNETLLVKSALMLGNGLVFVLLWQLLGAQRVDSPPVAFDRRVMAMALAGALLVVNGLIVHKERVLDTGAPMLVELRPVDPRSLMQGDYMTLRYRIADRFDSHPRDGQMVVRLDERGVADFVRWNDGAPLKAGERLLRYRDRENGVRLGAEAFFFQEGKGDLYAKARYGELRVTARGDAVLVGLRDEERNKLGRALR
jgi:uncharacterized membrane-anchored protein